MAKAAMQMMWQREANTLPITQITPPELVHEFIASQPGLDITCADKLAYLISYAPQLVIRGFGGAYEEDIESAYQRSRAARLVQRNSDSSAGTALTTDGRSPACDDEFALRDPEFGKYDAAHVACGFVQGNYVANGPPVIYYSHIDYTAWLLSDESKWLPVPIRSILTHGMAEWGVWPWESRETRAIEHFGFQDRCFTGKFADALYESDARSTLSLNDDARRDLEHRLGFSASLLRLPENGTELASRILEEDFLDHYYDAQAKARKA
jgi:hypothetical protein